MLAQLASVLIFNTNAGGAGTLNRIGRHTEQQNPGQRTSDREKENARAHARARAVVKVAVVRACINEFMAAITVRACEREQRARETTPRIYALSSRLPKMPCVSLFLCV